MRAVLVASAFMVHAGCHDKAGAPNADAGAADATTAAGIIDTSNDASNAPGDASTTTEAASGDASADDFGAPTESNDDLAQRMRHLLEAIAQNNPDLANDLLFPREAYVAVRDTRDPSKVWDQKIADHFRSAIKRLHTRIKGVDRAKFVSFELDKSVTQVQPKKHFKKPIWRVKNSKLTFTIDGKPHSLHVVDMVGWRGNWYIMRLR
ncbi:MAG: hypothetical protein FWD73_13595 [Polyangiaceae bacterium]|nr:hypothetical protein [Polyangiaceae bacterium]